MKKKYWYTISAMIISFIIGLNIVLPIFTGKNAYDYLMDVVSDTDEIAEVSDEVYDDENWWVYPELPPGQIYTAPELNWDKFWRTFKNHAYWSLEGWNVDSEEWDFYNDSLTINRDSVGDNSKKITLIFDAPCEVTTDYRLTFAIDYRVKQYVHKVDKYTYNISYEVNGESFNLSYNFSDIAAIPGIIINHGVTEDYFWFMARKNNVAPDTHVELDPTATVFTGANSYCNFAGERKLVRQSNGTLWCAFEEDSDVHVAFSLDAGVTWNDIEVWGADSSENPSIAVDSNDVVHLVFMSFKNDNDDWQLEYSNSTDWTTIVQIRDEDKYHTYPAIAVDSNDDLHVVYEKGEEGTSNDDQVAYINSMNNGGSWGTEQILTNEVNNGDDFWRPSIAINSTDGIHVVFICVDHFNGKNDILHMRSDDYGVTWSGWEADPIYQDAVKDQLYPCVAINDNDVMHVVWWGSSQNVNDQIGYSFNDSSSWKAVEWITWDPALDYRYPSISVNDNDYIHTAYEVVTTRLNHSINDTTSWTEDALLTGDYRFPNMISTQWPVIGGLKTNRPDTGYALICAFGTANITYHASADLAWETGVVPDWESGITAIGLSTNNEYNDTISWNATDEAPPTIDVFCNSSGFRNETVELIIVVNNTVNVSEVQVYCTNLNNTLDDDIIGATNITLWVSGDNSTWTICGDNFWGEGNGVFPDGGGNLSINATTWNGVGDDPFFYHGDGTLITSNCTIYLRFELDLEHIADFTYGNYTNRWWGYFYIANDTWIFYDDVIFNSTFNFTTPVIPQWNDVETWNGSIYNTSTHNDIDTWNGSIFNVSAHNTIETWNGSIYNLSSQNTISDWNGSIYNISAYNDIETWNGSIYNTSDSVTITRVSYSPLNIRINDTSYIDILFNITTESTPINQSSILFTHTVNQTTAGFGYNFTYRMLRDSVELRSMNRNEGLWFEKFNAITGTGEIGYYGEWGVHDNTSVKFNVVDYGSNWTTARLDAATTLVPHIFSNIWYIDRTDVQDNSSSIFDIYQNYAYKTKFNMTNTDFYNDPQYNGSLYQFYYNLNDTGTPTKPVKIYLANESYASGKPATSDNCVLIGEHYDGDVADYLIRNSSYWGINFSTNKAGFVGTLKLTDLFYFIFVSQAGDITNKYDLAFCDTNTSNRDFNNSQFVEYSANGGTAWSVQNGTIDCHLKYAKLDNTSRTEYKVYANDTSGNEAWSTLYTDLIDVVNVPPNPADILTQNGTITDYTVGDIINITYRWIGDPNQETCWVNTTCHNSTHVIVAYIQNRSITHAEVETNMTWYIDWNTISVPPGDYYHINITITDPYELSTGSRSSGEFNLSQWYDIETWNGSIYNVTTHITIDDWNGSIFNVTTHNDIETWNGSIFNVSITEWTNVETWNGSIYNITIFEINITKIGNITLVDGINASLGVNVNYTYNITNIGTATLTNISINETWFDCACSDWNFTLVSTNLTGGISNITWYNTSCYAIINITNLTSGNRYAFNMIINITECASLTSGYIINYANVSTTEFANESASHNITWESIVFTEFLRVRAAHPFGAIQTRAEVIFTVIGFLLLIMSILIIIGVVYVRYR